MERTHMMYLKEWLVSQDRKPLVIRGARQVGKTWLTRQLAKLCNKQLIEVNIEKRPEIATLFSSNNPSEILVNLEAAFETVINPETCILFLDEIQSAPELLEKLRWFAEDMPQLPLITAGSLLEFVLADHTFSMPVGRINYMYLEPLSFEEFLLANNKKILCEYLSSYNWGSVLPETIHRQLIRLFKEYMIIGGLPAAVSSWVNDHSLAKVSQKHHDLLTTYRDDFAKYKGNIAVEKLEALMSGIPKQLGQKFVYSQLGVDFSQYTIKQALALFNKARISHPVISCSANGIPLGAELREKFFKEIFLDMGLVSSALGLSLDEIETTQEINLINKGSMAEQVVGQLLRTVFPPYVEPSLYYWHRAEKGSNAEIDYIFQHGPNVIPIEVKAGSAGSLKSLHLFMDLKQLKTAVRINSDVPSKTIVRTKGHTGNPIEYTLLSMPFYLLGQIHRLLKYQTV